MLDRNVFRHKCRKAAGNPRSPRSIAATPACDNVWLTRERRRERERGGPWRKKKGALKECIKESEMKNSLVEKKGTNKEKRKR